jgi:uncharacterized delta-60 repeat protein
MLMLIAFRTRRPARLSTLAIAVALAGLASTADAANVHDGFNAGTDGNVLAAAVQADGRLLLGGTFTQVNGQPHAHLARLNVDGSLDASFNPQLDGDVRSLVVQADGSILVGGEFMQVAGTARRYLARLDAGGALDATFDPAPDQPVRSLAVQFDDKILVGGDFTHLAGAARAHLARLNLDGSLDPAFSADADAAVLALAPQPDGRLLAGGDFTQIAGQAQAHLARLGADGSPDAGFAAADGRVASLALDIDGSVLVGGDFAQIAGQARARLARLEADGTLDAGFVADADGAVSSLALQPDGAVLVGGAFTQIGGAPRRRLARLAADGTPEAGFDPAPDAAVAAIAVQADGGIVLGGAFAEAGGQTRAHVARVYAGGVLDRDLAPTFTSGGSFVTFAAQADNRIVMIGDVQAVDGQPVPNAARLEPDGSLDAAFTSNLPPWLFASTTSLYTQFDGRILAPGRVLLSGAPAYSDLFRLGADGTLDTTFDPQFGSATDPYPQIVTEQPDGRILVAGSFDSVAGQARYGLARLNADGSLDETFVPPYIYSSDGSIQCVAVQADGKVLIAGAFSQVGPDPNTHRFLARLNADGSLDADFNPVLDNFIEAVVPQTDGRILVAGFFRHVNGQSAPFLARLNADGSLDPTLSAAADSLVSAVVPLSNGKLMIGGTFKKIDGVPQAYVARLNADGSRDPSFAPAVNVTPSLSVVSLVVQHDGKVLVGGSNVDTVIDGEARPLIARLSADEAALQALSLSADHGRLEWRRGGGAPLLDAATFEFSTDGAAWTALGEAVAGDGAWSVDAAPLPRAQDVYIRARGRSPSGRQDMSSLPVEFLARLHVPDGFIVSPVARAGGGFAPAVPQQVAAGASVSFTLVPQSGYAIGPVEGCGGTLEGEVYTIAAVNADCRVVATFVPNGITDRVFADGFDGATR